MKVVLPILKTALEQLPSNKVLEFGVGVYSTPFLYKRCEVLISIEENIEWFTKISTDLTRNNRFKTIYNPYTENCTAKTLFSALDKNQKTKLRKFYNKWSTEKYYKDIDILLVDNFDATRVYALLAFYKNSKVSLYVVKPGKGVHGYEMLKKEKLDDYRHFSYQTYPTHVNMLLHKDVVFNLDTFSASLKEHQRTTKGLPKSEFKFIEL
jgi:hypothetical protein